MAGIALHHAGVRSLMVVVVTSCLLAACDSSNDSGSNGNPSSPGANAVTLLTLSGQNQDSEPVDDALGQIEAELLSQFGSADSTPILVEDTDTVQTLLKKR